MREVEVLIEASEAYTKKAFGLTVKFSEMFNLSVIPDLLLAIQWTSVLPVFIPQGVDNRQAVNSLVTAGHKKPYESVDVMQYKGSEASDKPNLYLIEHSVRPNADTMGWSPNNLVKTGKRKLWLPQKGYAIAQGLHHLVTSKYLDSETFTWFPGETLPGGRSAGGLWRSGLGGVRFDWADSAGECVLYGARLAIPVPLKL